MGVNNVKQRRINIDMNNLIQRGNNIVIFNSELHNISKRRNNVVKKIQIEYTEFKVLTTIS